MRAPTSTQPERRTVWVLGGIISLLALADGALHFALDYVMFHGQLWGSFHPSGPPPGGAPGGPGGPSFATGHAGPPPGPHFSLPMPNNELFVLNAIGYIALVIAFWLGDGLLRRWRWLIDAAMAVYAAFSIWAWFEFGAPNPNGLGYIAKALEAALIVALAVHAWYVTRRPSPDDRSVAALRHRRSTP